MNRRATAFIAVLLVGVAALACIVALAGVSELRLASQRKRKDLDLDQLPGASGWIGVMGCMRHDLAVGVTSARRVYKLGESIAEVDENGKTDDRVFTPLAAHDDCQEGKPPARLYALIENDEALGTTISGVYAQAVSPPPVPVVVTGVIGFGAGHLEQAAAARDYFSRRGLLLDAQPLLAKGRGPGPLWVAIVTLLAGVHGLLFCAFAGVWAWRRRRRRRAIEAGHITDEEEAFFESETLD